MRFALKLLGSDCKVELQTAGNLVRLQVLVIRDLPFALAAVPHWVESKREIATQITRRGRETPGLKEAIFPAQWKSLLQRQINFFARLFYIINLNYYRDGVA